MDTTSKNNCQMTFRFLSKNNDVSHNNSFHYITCIVKCWNMNTKHTHRCLQREEFVYLNCEKKQTYSKGTWWWILLDWLQEMLYRWWILRQGRRERKRFTEWFHKMAVWLAPFSPFPPVSSSFIPILTSHHPLRTAALLLLEPWAFGCDFALGSWLLVDLFLLLHMIVMVFVHSTDLQLLIILVLAWLHTKPISKVLEQQRQLYCFLHTEGI